jgi:hypothetical protein
MVNKLTDSTQYLLSLTIRILRELICEDVSGNIPCQSLCYESVQPVHPSKGETSDNLSSLAGVRASLQNCLDDKSAQGILIKAGRAAFHTFLADHGNLFGWFNTEFNLLSPRKRLKNGLDKLSQYLYPRTGQPVSISGNEKAWFWRDPDCPWCSGRISSSASCGFTTGFLQEFASWAGAGKTYLVREIECLASGGCACTFQIEKRPLD